MTNPTIESLWDQIVSSITSQDHVEINQSVSDVGAFLPALLRDLSDTELLNLTASLTEKAQVEWEAMPIGLREFFGYLFVELNSRVDGDADRFRELADLVSAKTDLDLPWDKVKLGQRGVAILYNFVPFSDTGASVASKRLRDIGAKVDVISCSSIGRKAIDFSPFRVSRPYIENLITLPLAPSWASWKPQYEFIRSALEEIASQEERRGKYSFIYTRAMWVPSHYVGVLRKLQDPDIEWIAEFSDPLSLDVEGLPRAEHPPQDDEVYDGLVAQFEAKFGPVDESERGIFRMAELLSYAFADRIVFTNDHQKTTMLEHISNSSLRDRVLKHAEVSNHPTLPRPYYEAEKPEIHLEPGFLNLGYFGQFYASRGLGDVTRAMRMLPYDVLRRIKLHVFTTYVPPEAGGKKPAGLAKKQYEDQVARTMQSLGDSGLEDQVQLHPSLPYLQFLGVLDDFDYLIVNDARSGANHSVNPYLPSKYGDYRGSTSKIWALCEEGSQLALGESHVKTPLGDANEARQFLLSAVKNKGL